MFVCLQLYGILKDPYYLIRFYNALFVSTKVFTASMYFLHLVLLCANLQDL